MPSPGWALTPHGCVLVRRGEDTHTGGRPRLPQTADAPIADALRDHPAACGQTCGRSSSSVEGALPGGPSLSLPPLGARRSSPPEGQEGTWTKDESGEGETHAPSALSTCSELTPCPPPAGAWPPLSQRHSLHHSGQPQPPPLWAAEVTSLPLPLSAQEDRAQVCRIWPAAELPNQVLSAEIRPVCPPSTPPPTMQLCAPPGSCSSFVKLVSI